MAPVGSSPATVTSTLTLPAGIAPLAGQVSKPFLGSGRAEMRSAVSCAGVSLFSPSALKFSAVTPSVFCTAGDHTAIPGFTAVFDFGLVAVGLVVACCGRPDCPDITTSATTTPETCHNNAIRLTTPPAQLIVLRRGNRAGASTK